MDKGQKKSLFAEVEQEILSIWRKEKIYDRVVKLRADAPYFSFYDGPPFASGEPHYGHLEQTAIKDAVARYKMMQGFQVPRRTGWDTHGLPIEYIIEKELGLNSKKDIVGYGIDKFNAACKAIVFRHQQDFNQMYERMGRWADPADAYATLNNDYMESVWWAMSQLHQKDLLYRGFKSMPYCPRCATPLSNFELNEGYKDNVTDPSVFVLFPLVDDPKTKLLAWTTTPWTLPANAALAIDSQADYSYVELKSDASTLVLAKERLDVLDLRKSEYKLLKTVKGKDLVGLKYQGLYELPSKTDPALAKNAHQVFADQSVNLEDGTGILHVAPRYGETDLALGQAENLPLIESVDATGHQTHGPTEAVGKFFKAADGPIIADLTKRGRIFAAETAEHTYPFCWRCDTPLMYFATSTWFVSVSQIRDQMLKTADPIAWVPGHIKINRFGKWLEGARDWSISRNRFWGNPVPIWVNEEDENDYIVVGSLAELEELSGEAPPQDLHRPFIDKVTITKNGKTYRRVEEVLDCWFESGSMSYAQDHYPFENKELFDQKFPADFIVEGIDQVRLWFYVLHVLATALFDKPAYKNVLATGLILAADGKKLSKRLRNYPPIDLLLDKYGADTVRFFVLSSPLMNAEDTRLNEASILDIHRNLFMTLSNSYNFFKTYAEVDKWQMPTEVTEPLSDNPMDQWIIARLNETVLGVSTAADSYQLSKAVRPIIGLVDDLSNWHIRRSRRRFWKSENDEDKKQAYATLHYCLVRTCQLLAPFAPFLSDKIYRDLTDSSVHLSDWPSVNQPDSASQKLLEDMKIVREAIAEGLAQRAQAKIKVRQPLKSVSIGVRVSNKEQLADIIAEELNVKEVEWTESDGVVLDATLTTDLKDEGAARDIIRAVQSARKKAGFNVEDRIELSFMTDSAPLKRAFTTYKDLIFAETLTLAELKASAEYEEQVSLGGMTAELKLKRA